MAPGRQCSLYAIPGCVVKRFIFMLLVLLSFDSSALDVVCSSWIGSTQTYFYGETCPSAASAAYAAFEGGQYAGTYSAQISACSSGPSYASVGAYTTCRTTAEVCVAPQIRQPDGTCADPPSLCQWPEVEIEGGTCENLCDNIPASNSSGPDSRSVGYAACRVVGSATGKACVVNVTEEYTDAGGTSHQTWGATGGACTPGEELNCPDGQISSGGNCLMPADPAEEGAAADAAAAGYAQEAGDYSTGAANSAGRAFQDAGQAAAAGNAAAGSAAVAAASGSSGAPIAQAAAASSQAAASRSYVYWSESVTHAGAASSSASGSAAAAASGAVSGSLVAKFSFADVAQAGRDSAHVSANDALAAADSAREERNTAVSGRLAAAAAAGLPDGGEGGDGECDPTVEDCGDEDDEPGDTPGGFPTFEPPVEIPEYSYFELFNTAYSDMASAPILAVPSFSNSGGGPCQPLTFSLGIGSASTSIHCDLLESFWPLANAAIMLFGMVVSIRVILSA